MAERPTFGDFILGFEGLGILRSWLLDPAAVRTARNRIFRIVQQFDEVPWSEAMDAYEQTVTAGYAERVASYDKPGNPVLLAEQPVVRGLLADCSVGVALDAACGTGRHAAYLDSLGFRVTGIDATPAMLEVARGKVPGAHFETADLKSIPLPDGSADLAVCALALTHCAALGPPLRELARVVRPGGTIIISDVHPFLVMLGGHSDYSLSEDERAFVRNYVHLPSDYVGAFREAGLSVLQCIEPLWGDEEIARIGFAQRMPELADSAVRGVPIVIVWALEKVA